MNPRPTLLCTSFFLLPALPFANEKLTRTDRAGQGRAGQTFLSVGWIGCCGNHKLRGKKGGGKKKSVLIYLWQVGLIIIASPATEL